MATRSLVQARSTLRSRSNALMSAPRPIATGSSWATTLPRRTIVKCSPLCSTASSNSEKFRAALVALISVMRSDYQITAFHVPRDSERHERHPRIGRSERGYAHARTFSRNRAPPTTWIAHMTTMKATCSVSRGSWTICSRSPIVSRVSRQSNGGRQLGQQEFPTRPSLGCRPSPWACRRPPCR